MSILQRIKYGAIGAYQGFMNPREETSLKSVQMTGYEFAWAYYKRNIFAPNFDWSLYLNERGLYKKTRLIFNPVPTLTDFYVDNLWSPAKNEKFPTLATPLVENTDEKIVAAVGQVDQWVNWLSEAQKIKKYAAASGAVLVEVADDLEREKILQKTYWKGYVKELELNSTGDVLSYAIEYNAYDSVKDRNYVYKKVVTKETVSYFYDNSAFVPPGAEASSIPNPYGFCPAVWIKHSDDGSIGGIPACQDFYKVDHVNSLASHLHDNIHKEIESGKIIGMEKPETLTVLTGGTKNKDGSMNMPDPRLERVLLAAQGEVSVHDLSGMLKLAEAHPYLKDLLVSFADDYPELEYRQILKDNPTLSGIALERLLTPAQNRLDGVQSNYNQQLTKLRQMQLAIGGWRTRNGWKRKTKQQALFTPFDLDSYERGELDFYLKPSVLIEQTEEDKEDLLGKKAARANSLQGIVDEETLIDVAGFNEEQKNEILSKKAVAV